MKLKNQKFVDSLLKELDKIELDEAMGTTPGASYVNRGINIPKTGTFGLNSTEIKPKKTSGSVVSDFLQNTTDTYAKQNIVPSLLNTTIINKFGSLSPEQQTQLQNQASDFYNKLKETDWTKQFYSTDLLHKKIVKLATFIKRVGTIAPTTPVPPTVENFYTNYVYLLALFENENSIFTTPGARNDDIIFLNSGEESRAYIKATREPNLFVGASGSGRYLDFTQAALSNRTEEALKITSFATSMIEQVKSKTVNNLLPFFTSQNEKTFLETVNKNQLFTVFLDSLVFALVDTLNLPLGKDYGKGHQAAFSLLTSQLINSQMYGETLLQVKPTLAEDVRKKLEQCSNKVNPFVLNITNLQSATNRAVSKNNIFNPKMSTILMTFGNLISNLARATGTEHFNLTNVLYASPNLTNPRDVSKEKLAELSTTSSDVFSSTSKREAFANPFIRIVFYKEDRANGNYRYILQPKNVSGYEFRKEGTNIVENTVSNTNNWKGFVIPGDLHEFLCRTSYEKQISYSSAFIDLDKNSETMQNVIAGEDESTEGILLHFLESIQKEDGSFISNFVVFALIPKIMFQCGDVLPEFKSSSKEILNFTGFEKQMYKKYVMSIKEANDTDVKAAFDYMKETILEMEPIQSIQSRFLKVMYNYDSTREEIEAIKKEFIILVKNIRRGYWTCATLDEQNMYSGYAANQIFGVFDPLIDIKGDLQVNPQISNKTVKDYLMEYLKNIEDRPIKEKAKTSKTHPSMPLQPPSEPNIFG